VLGLLGPIRITCQISGLQKLYSALNCYLVNQTSLFDGGYYLETNADVAQKRVPPLRHYVDYGDREGRLPMAVFDPIYYRAHVGDRAKRVNALLHYAYIGRYRRISPSPWFDAAYYLSNNKDVARAGIDPLIHYLKWGGLEGRSPSPQFDGAYYLRSNPQVLEAHINPLIHYLLYGRLQGRCTLPSHGCDMGEVSNVGGVSRPLNLHDEAWDKLEARANIDNALIDIVIPVYKGRIETLRCVYSVLASTSGIAFELVVINDMSPDQKLVEELHRLADKELFTLLSNSDNRGFVYTVNRGMMLHRDRDVVLLNADTEVYDGWLGRLRRAANRSKRTGTVTPLSNNATICSYPRFLQDNPYPLELGYAELDKITAKVNREIEVEAPTGVGFCMYIKRLCLDEVGLFDESAFGRGYGEENDFCQRAILKSWVNIIAADVFVRHWGATSFKGEKAKRVQVALKVMSKRHPRYESDVHEFIKRDLLAGARYRLDQARLRRMRRERNVLIVCHNRGGGTERHVQEDIRRLSRQGFGVFLLRPMVGNPCHAMLSHYALKSTPNLLPLSLTDAPMLTKALQKIRITDVHTHSLVDFVPECPNYLHAVIKLLGAKWEVNLHDYKVICPRINLVDLRGRYCGERGEAACNKCLLEYGSDFRVTDINAWRAMHEKILRIVDNVSVPDQDVAERLSRYFPKVNFEVSPHEDIDPQKTQVQAPTLLLEERLRVVVIGAIGKIKGYDVLLACAKDAKKRNLPLDYIVMGYSQNDRLLEQSGVLVTGRYMERDAVRTLCNLSPHSVWLPSIWPETYSYTLSLALKAGYPVFAFQLGAISRRLLALGGGHTVWPLSDSDNPQKINRKFMFYRDQCEKNK